MIVKLAKRRLMRTKPLLSAYDAASYIFELSRRVGGYGRQRRVCDGLLPRWNWRAVLAAEALAMLAIQSRAGKAAPEDAA